MDKRMSGALDRHITGNYGEDQYREDVYDESQKELNQNLLKRVRALEVKVESLDSGIKLWIDAHQAVTKSQIECITEMKDLIIFMMEK